MIRIKNRDMLLTVTITFVAGSLLHRVFPLAGLIVMACALVFYVLCCARRAIRTLSRFSAADGKEKGLALVWLGMLLLAVNVFWVMGSGGNVSYFFILVMLGADFLLRQKKRKNAK